MIRVIGIGKVKEGPFKELIEDYRKRIQPYHPLKVEEVKDEPIVSNDSPEAIKKREGDRLLKVLKDDEYVILLHLQGKEISSEKLAEKLEKDISAHPKICFVIAGSLGPSREVIERADAYWKLSDLTFLHQMTKVIVLEQIYRAFKILHHENYHK